MQVLAEAARRVEAETPWYEMLGLRCAEAAGGGGDVANETLLAPASVLLKGLLGAAHGAEAAREEMFELIRYCVGISRSCLRRLKVEYVPRPVVTAVDSR